MLFSSLVFLWIFLPVVFVISKLFNIKLQNLFLLIASLLFYAWGEPKYIVLMVVSIIINYLAGLIIYNTKNFVKKFFLFIFVVIDLLILGYFKYANLFFGTNIPLPIGISFFTFQAMSYIVDVYRKDVKAQKNIINIALYISFFPQLIAGPIIKYKDVNAQIENRKVNLEKLSTGVKRFIYGLAKKVIISNALASVVDTIYSSMPVSSFGFNLSWVVSVFYMFQIYYDFSGYSDMAIGLGKMFGFDYSENFNLPYISHSITELWRRWHISLSTWFREYVYIPLGGNRKGLFRTCINLFIVFALTGFWHGANYNFLIWGMMHGVLIILEKLFLKKVFDKVKILGWVFTLLFFNFTMVFFRNENMLDAMMIIHRMINYNKFIAFDIDLSHLLNNYVIFIFIIAVICAGPIQIVLSTLDKIITKLKLKKNIFINFIIDVYTLAENVVLIILLLYCFTELASNTYNPFIYFRF